MGRSRAGIGRIELGLISTLRPRTGLVSSLRRAWRTPPARSSVSTKDTRTMFNLSLVVFARNEISVSENGGRIKLIRLRSCKL
jgi:hypothetical protein